MNKRLYRVTHSETNMEEAGLVWKSLCLEPDPPMSGKAWWRCLQCWRGSNGKSAMARLRGYGRITGWIINPCCP